MNTVEADLVVCVSSHMSGEHAMVTNEGLILRADDPRVLAAPDHFMPKDTPRSEWPTVWDVAVERNDANNHAIAQAKQEARERLAKQNTVTLSAPVYVKALRDIVGEYEGQPATVRKGSALPVDHAFVVDHREDFSA